MKIEILRSVMIAGELAEAGSFLEVGQPVANLLIGMGKARLAPEPAPAPAPEAEAPKKSRKPAAPIASEED